MFFHNLLKKSLNQLFDQPNINKAPYLIQIFKGFHLMSFLYPGIPPGHHITFSHLVSSAMTVSQMFLVLVDLDGVGGSVDQVFCECPPVAICLVSPPHG